MSIPTRFNMGQVQGSGADYFLRLLQQQAGAGARPSASITGGLPTARRGTPIVRKRPPMPQIGLRGIRDISALPAGGGMTSLQRDLAAKMGLGAQKPEAPKAPPSLMDRLTPAVGTPAFAGLSKAAATGLQLSGYQDKPITTGAGLGAMFGAGMEAYTAEKKAQAAAELAKQQRETDIALKMMEIRAQQAATERDISGKEFTQEKDLRKEFTTQSKDFTEAKLGFEKVQNAAMAKTPSGATDIALVFGYMKVLDPNSVVREGEFATAANAGGVGETIRNYYNKILEGTLLTDKVRRQFVSSARTQFQPYLQQQQARETEFTELSQAYKLDPTKVVRSKLPSEGSLAMPYKVNTQEEAEALPKGSYVMIGGRLARVK